MTATAHLFRIALWGTFRLYRADGERLHLSSRKGMALLAMLITAADGERTRAWLQDRLWGTRGRVQAQQSLRRELAGLRLLLTGPAGPLIGSDGERVWIDRSACVLDRGERQNGAAFLEGFDIPGADGFEEWLREQRQLPESDAPARSTLPHLPRSVVDLEISAPGFGGRPALAILPLGDATGDPAFAHWAGGLGAELARRLSCLRWLPVIAASTMDRVAAIEPAPEAAGRLVGAGYVLSGHVTKADDWFTLHLALLGAKTGQLLWSDGFDIALGGTTEPLDDLAGRIVALLASRIETNEHVQVLDRPIDDLAVQELSWRARWHMRRFTREDAATARELLARAIALRPHAAEALILYAWTLAWDVWSQRGGNDEIDSFRNVALRARDADPFDGRAYMLLGMAELWQRRFETAEPLLTEAVRLNPSLVNAWGNIGSLRYLTGDPAAAIAPLRTGLRLSPYDTEAFYLMGELAISYLMLGLHDAAIEHANLALARRPAYVYAHIVKINALHRVGDADAARIAKAKLLNQKSGFDSGFVDWLPFQDGEWPRQLKEGLAAVG